MLQSFLMWILNGETKLNLKRDPIFFRNAIAVGNKYIAVLNQIDKCTTNCHVQVLHVEIATKRYITLR